MKRYVIERDLPGIGGMSAAECAEAAKTSNAALARLGPKVQWNHSYVAGDKTFCVYMAEDEGAVKEHAELSGFPASKITEVVGMLDPTSATA